jgi:hypothetical protein
VWVLRAAFCRFFLWLSLSPGYGGRGDWTGRANMVGFFLQANEHNRKHLESLPETSFPLSA